MSPTRDGSLVAFSLVNVLHSDPTSITRSPKKERKHKLIVLMFKLVMKNIQKQVETPTYYKATFRTDHVSCPVVLHQYCIGVIGALHLGKRVSTKTDEIPEVRKNPHELLNSTDIRKQLFVCELGLGLQNSGNF